jgi:small-conductance mechanosensitive channel
MAPADREGEIDMDRSPWIVLADLAVAGFGAAAITWVIGHLIARIARRADLPSVLALDRYCRRAWVVTFAAIAVLVTTHGLGLNAAWQRSAVLGVITAACWLLLRLLVVGEQIVLGRLRVDVEDNRRIRRARTQVTLLRRVVAAVVIVLGLAAGLMSFPELRTFGASLLASAGLAGIVAGLAAQTTLANMFAGLQLAFTDAVRIDDVVVVEEEWGWIEEITLTYVVLHIWDERRLVLPTSYFTTTPFQNWTRTQARVLGSVILHLDYATPLAPLREHAEAVIAASSRWDRRDWVLQVTDTTETTMVVRVLASAVDAPTAWDLRCEIREALLTFLQENHPQSLPVQRVLIDQPSLEGRTEPSPNPLPANRDTDPARTALPVHPNLHGADPSGADPSGADPSRADPGAGRLRGATPAGAVATPDAATIGPGSGGNGSSAQPPVKRTPGNWMPGK